MKKTFLKLLLGILLIPILSYIGYLGYQATLAPGTTATAATTEPAVVEPDPEVVSAEAKVVPARYVQLGFKSPGVIDEVLVAQGDIIKEGQLIARLEGQEQAEAAVTAAQLELTSAEQSRDEIQDHQELRAALAQQAVYEAQDSVDKAQSLVDGMTRTASNKQIEEAEAAVAEAEKQLEQTKKRLQRYADLVGASPDSAASAMAVAAAEKEYRESVSYLNALQGKPSDNDIARAEANLVLAQAQLKEAERQNEILQAGPDPDEMALADARVAAAEDKLAAAEAALGDLQLLAPFSGEITSLNMKAGEVANPSVAGVTLADLSSWQVETTDLTENDVSLISPGMEANITLNAFPDRSFKGVVKEIDRQGVESRGAVTFTVRLDFNPENAPVLWEMTAFVEFQMD
jgi:multidrug efflux pump subunit AcrA (membrane-fusion protein)